MMDMQTNTEKEQKTLKWHYDKTNQQWYVNNTPEGYDYLIDKVDKNAFTLTVVFSTPHYADLVDHTFSKLKSAKTVANLIENG